MELGLDRKTVFIAGSSSGIGLSIAEHFQEEGAQVVITGRDRDKLEKAYQFLKGKGSEANILKVQADLSRESEVKKAFEMCIKHFGKLDVAIANVGSGKEPLNMDFDEETWKSSFDQNLLSSILVTKYAAQSMVEQKSGAIILISSIVSIEDIKAPIAYSAHKAALNAATKKFSRQLGVFGVRVNAIVPGNIFFLGGTWERRLKDDPEGIKAFIEREVPLRGLGDPSDIANMAIFLASEKAKFITGSLIVVDGGQTKSF